MNQLATQTTEGNLIAPGIDIERKLWNITKGAYDDLTIVGVFAGTATEAHALIAELNMRDVANIAFLDDAYDFEQANAIRTADDILGAAPHGQFGHANDPGNCAACHTEEFGQA